MAFDKRREGGNKSNDMLLKSEGAKPAGGQDEFQIFDKHVKAGKSPDFVAAPSLFLPRSRRGLDFKTEEEKK